MINVTLEESIIAFYKCILNKESIESAFSLNPKDERKRRREEDKPLILKLLKEGHSQYGLALDFGIPRATIIYWVKKEEVC